MFLTSWEATTGSQRGPSQIIYNLFLMDTARIAELLQPFLRDPNGQRPATNGLYQHISTYIDLLSRWNARINLTAVRHPEEIVTRHFGESLFAACHLFPRSSSASSAANDVDLDVDSANDDRPTTNDGLETTDRLIDIGSGAGFPGLPIKLWLPRLHLTLIESNQKKVTFLRELIRTLTLTDVDVFSGRAETFSSTAAVVTLRAVERFEAALPVASRLVSPHGRLALLIGQAQVPRTRELTPGFHWQDPVPVPLSAARVLLIGARKDVC